MVAVDVETLMAPGPPRIAWGWYLAAGIAWVAVAVAILSLDPVALSLVAVCVAFVIVLAGLNELAHLFEGDGWRWLHGIVGLALVGIGALALAEPMQTFQSLSVLLGIFLVIKGVAVIVLALAVHGEGSLWGFLLVAGAFTALLGVWALGAPQRSAALLALWLGAAALLHGMIAIFHAFERRSA